MGEYMRREFGTATTLLQALKKGEYRTYGVGKWHLPFKYGPTCRGVDPITLGPFSIGFDHYAGTRGNGVFKSRDAGQSWVPCGAN